VTDIPFQVDYTSRDYASLRDDLILRVQSSVPEWNSTDPSDFGVAMVEAFAYMGDLMSYYIDRAANESALATATRRASVIAISRDLGYEPSGYTPSMVTVTFTNTSDTSLTVPERTVVTASVESGDALLDIPFETTTDVTVPADGTATVSCMQGQTRTGDTGYGEVLGVSNGYPYQSFDLPDSSVVRESVIVYVYDGVNFYPWVQVPHIADYGSNARVFRVLDDGYQTVSIDFGDGTSGLVPSASHVIFAEYRVVDGTNGNVIAGSIDEITTVPGLTEGQVAVLSGSLTVTNNDAAVGGSDPEDLESIRFNASQAYRTNTRAVTLEDYQNLALGIPNCGKASAMSVIPGNVLVVIAPDRGFGGAEENPGFEETSPGVWTATTELTDVQSLVLARVEANALAGSTTTIVDPVYSYLTIEVSVVALPSVRQSDAEKIISQAIVEKFDYSRVGFGATVYENDIVTLISSLGVVNAITIDNLSRTADAPAVEDVIGDYDEVILLKEADLTVVVTGGASG
jgi:hypothetical protein